MPESFAEKWRGILTRPNIQRTRHLDGGNASDLPLGGSRLAAEDPRVDQLR